MRLFFDLGITKDGDFKIDELIGTNKKDFSLASNDITKPNSSMRQQIFYRLKTVLNSARYAEDYGLGLEKYIGEPNSAETRESIRNDVIQELLKDNLLEEDEFEVFVYPVGETKVIIVIMIRIEDDNVIPIKIPFSFSHGILPTDF